jgi:DNA polymerase V
MGINTAYDLAIQTVESIQAQFNIVVARTVMELNGISCLSLDETTTNKQQIVCSRSFKPQLTEYHQLAEALASFCSRAAEKLRYQNSVAGSMSVFIRTNPHKPNEPQYQRSVHLFLNQETSDTRKIIHYSKQLLSNIFKLGYRYQKCGVQLGHIKLASIPQQTDLFNLTAHSQLTRDTRLMNTVDDVNRRFPKAIAFSAERINTGWQTPVKYLSQSYTTHWNDIALVKCN